MNQQARKVVRRILTVFAVIIGLVVMLLSTYGSSSVCVECGCKSSAIDYQLPLMPGTTYWRRGTIEQTPFSKVARALGFTTPHSHNWKLIHGGGNGITCALGHGGQVDRTVRSPEVAQFIDCTHQYQGRDEAHAWFEIALDYQHSEALVDWLGRTGFPESGFSSATDYDEWRQRANPEWLEVLRVNLEQWPEHARPNKLLNPMGTRRWEPIKVAIEALSQAD